MASKTCTNDTAHSVEIENCNDHILICFLGDVDAFTVSEFKENIRQNVQNNAKDKDILLDLSKVEFIDSHAVGLFVSILKLAHKNNNKLIFIGVSGQPKSILKMVGFNEDIVYFCDSINDAKN